MNTHASFARGRGRSAWRRRVITAVASCVVVLATASESGAQAQNDSSLLARADQYTVGDYCRLASAALADTGVQRALADERALVDVHLERICDARVAAMPLRSLTGRGAASLAAVARLRQPAFQQLAAVPLDTAMRIVRSRLRSTELRPLVRQALGDSANQRFFTVSETAAQLYVRDARDRAVARVARYERKLGPQSPQLNGVEVLLNYSAQRWVPGFAPSVVRGPSPLEVIASYVPTYATVSNGDPVAVSASEFGVRRYLFGDAWGKTGKAGLLRPAYVSLGALVASDRSAALAWPWDGRTRTGVFAGWGQFKVAYIPGRKSAVLVARQMQIVPFAF